MKVSPSCRLYFALSSTKQTWTGTQSTPCIFGLCMQLAACLLHLSHADVCRLLLRQYRVLPRFVPPLQQYDTVGNTSGRFVMVVSSCQNVRVRKGPEAIISTLCLFSFYSGVHHTNRWLAAQTILDTLVCWKSVRAADIWCSDPCHLQTLSVFLNTGTSFAWDKSCRFTLRGCFQLRCPRRRQSLRHAADCRANVCWQFFAFGLCVQLAFFLGF